MGRYASPKGDRFMDCSDASVRLKDLVAGRLPPTERKAIEQHLRSCPACAAAAVSRAHPAEERALWEHAGRAAARHVQLRHASPNARPPEPRPASRHPVVLRHARRSATARTSLSLGIRLLQATAVGLAGTIVALCAVHFGHLNDFLGLDRWMPRPAASPSPAKTVNAAPAPQEARVFREASHTLAEVAVVTNGPELSRRIRSDGLVARLRAARQRPHAPAWIRSAAARVEAVLIRAEAAGSDVEEWRLVRSYVAKYDLIRVCEDLDAGVRLLSNGNGS